jgi:hypothetical protein
LSEADPNTSTTPRKTAKLEKNETGRTVAKTSDRESTSALPMRASSAKSSTTGTVFNALNTDQSEGKEGFRKEEIDYRNKDNSKLRRFLSERCLSTHGTREELITRLENSSIDYESLSSATITEMLRDRQVVCSSRGNKDYKIERLRINDQAERDSGKSGEAYLYGTLSAMEMVLTECHKFESRDYSTLKPAKLAALLDKRKLAKSGSAAVLIKRLQKDDRMSNEKRRKLAQAKHDQVKRDLETKTGRSVIATDVMEREDRKYALESQLQREFEGPPPKPVCDYDWKDSHWAGRTERELSEICQRRGMPGYGPRAAMLKWLDTGNVDYEDLYVGGLQRICTERGLEFREKDKKVDLVRRLQEADEVQ